MKIKFFHIVSYLTIALTISTVLYIAFLSLYSPTVITVKQPMQIDKEVYKIGDTLIYTIDFCKYRNYEVVDLKRFLEDGYLFALPNDLQDIYNTPLGCHKAQIKVPLVVPASIETNHEYSVKVVIQRRVNYFRTETETYETVKFKLIK